MARASVVTHDGPAATRGWDVVVGRQRHDQAVLGRHSVTHSHATLAFQTGGRLRIEQKGEWSLRAGDVLLVPAGEPHRTLGGQGAECWGLTFCVPCLGTDGAAALLAPFERVRDGAAPIVRIPAGRRAFFDGLFRELELVAEESRGASETRHAVQRSLLTLILNEVDRASSAMARAPTTRHSVVSDSLRFIERNCLGPLTLNDVAAAIDRSPSYVTTALTRATGRSAVQWIVSGRMAEARRLLLHSDERVEIVAERVGYADATHFIRMFRRAHGCTPTAWRAANTPAPETTRARRR